MTQATRLERMLQTVERVGNKLPDPAVLFLILMLATWALSALLAIALLMGGLMVLMLDLGRPDRLIVAMTHFNFKSIFAMNIFFPHQFPAGLKPACLKILLPGILKKLSAEAYLPLKKLK